MWLIFLTAATAVAVIAAGASATSSSSPTSTGKGFGVDGKAYSDASISEGELAEAASHGDKAASDELARRQTKKWGSLADSALGTGSTIEDYALAGYDLAKAINTAVSEDIAANANTPEQKARLAAAVTKIIMLGYPPTRFAWYAEFGVEEQAAVIETDISFIEHAPIAVSPFLGTIDYAHLAQQIGQAAFQATGGVDPSMLLATFRQMADRRANFGFFGSFRAIDLLDFPPNAAELATMTRPPVGSSGPQNPLYTALVYVALASAGRFPDLSRDTAFEIVAANARSFNDRHGITSRADALSTSPAAVGQLGWNGATSAGAVCCEAWFAIVRYAATSGIRDMAPEKPLLTPAGVAPRVSLAR